jgi:hypothetical protein
MRKVNVISVKTFVGPNQQFQNAGAVELNRVVQLNTIYPDLASQVATLRDDVVPTGTIQPFWGTAKEAAALQATGWWICDGRTISDPLADKLNNTKTPDLRGMFLMGSDHATDSGGSQSFAIPDQPIKTWTNGFDNSRMIFMAPPVVVTPIGWVTGAEITSYGTVTGTNVPTVPPYRTVIYIMKVRSSEFTPKTVKP